MAKRKRQQDSDSMLAEGRGTGIGRDYKPWIKIQDVASIGRIKDFGVIWFNKLIEVLKTNMSLRSMAGEMGCDSKTIVKYSEKLGYGHLIRSNMNIHIRKVDSIEHKTKFSRAENYRGSIIMFMEETPDATISSIRHNRGKEFIWLYKNEPE